LFLFSLFFPLCFFFPSLPLPSSSSCFFTYIPSGQQTMGSLEKLVLEYGIVFPSTYLPSFTKEQYPCNHSSNHNCFKSANENWYIWKIINFLAKMIWATFIVVIFVFII
jgi:hypothetical protein